MQVTLDQDTWEVSNDAALGEVLADVSDRAYAQGRLVCRLTVGGRAVTDRDLQQTWLEQAIGCVGSVAAATRTLDDLATAGRDTARRLGQSLADEAGGLSTRFRQGNEDCRALDSWIGALADYVEWHEQSRARGCGAGTPGAVSDGVEQLLAARHAGDFVKVADVLEYDLAPALRGGIETATISERREDA